MPNYTRTALKINANKTHGGINVDVLFKLSSPVWDHVDIEMNKRQPVSKDELWDVPKKPGELYLN